MSLPWTLSYGCAWSESVIRTVALLTKKGLLLSWSCPCTSLQWRSQEFVTGVHKVILSLPLSLPSTALPSPPLPSPPLPPPHLPSLPLEVWPLKSSYRVCGALWAVPVGSGAEPQPKSNLVHFSLKIWHLVATILIIFLRINWPTLYIFLTGGAYAPYSPCTSTPLPVCTHYWHTWTNEQNKYERYYRPGRRPLAYLLQYMLTVSPVCA